MESIAILTTGGTIDKIYFDARSTYQVGPPYVEQLLGELNLCLDYRIESLLRKDSLDLSDADRELIRTAAASAPESKLVITHGTDTMVETGRCLLGLKDKTIVLTGALQPARFKTSDALFNLGCALTAAQLAAPGVHIVMNGRVFDCPRVRKNLQTNRFEAV